MPKHTKPWKKDKMIRSCCHLREKQVAILNSIADKTGVSVAELIRNAIDEMYLKG
jgi:Ribbon-helix-helix protein, copG family